MSGYLYTRDAVDGDVWLTVPTVVLSDGPLHTRDAEKGDPPYVPPKQPLGFLFAGPEGDDEEGEE